MSAIYRVGETSHPSQHGSAAYIYSIAPLTQNGIAAISSANELLILDRLNLNQSPVLRLHDVPQNVSCLVVGDDMGHTTMCCGSDGTVVTHDMRLKAVANQFKLEKALTALARKGHQIAVGTELSNHQAVVSVWDQRQNQQIWQNAENNDDITALDFHPNKDNIILAGGDDGQVSIFDTLVAEEDDSLIQGFNHSPIHKAGFLGDHRFFALSSDQNLSIHQISSLDEQGDPPPTFFGDLRPLVPCEYVIDVFQTGGGFAVAAGSNISDPNVKIVELRHARNENKAPVLKPKSAHTLEGAHGEEVVRSVFVDDATQTIYTAGEDGAIRAFRQVSDDMTSRAQEKTTKSKKPAEGRYKPY